MILATPGTLPERRGGVDARHILRNRCSHIDVQHVLDHLVLTDIDVAVRDRWNECLEYEPGARMITGQKCLGSLAQMCADVIGIRVTDVPSGFGKQHGLVDDSLGWAARPPARLSSCRTCDERVQDRGTLLVLHALQHASDERPELRSCHSFQSSVEMVCGWTKDGAPAWASPYAHRAPSESRASCTSPVGIS